MFCLSFISPRWLQWAVLSQEGLLSLGRPRSRGGAILCLSLAGSSREVQQLGHKLASMWEAGSTAAVPQPHQLPSRHTFRLAIVNRITDTLVYNVLNTSMYFPVLFRALFI